MIKNRHIIPNKICIFAKIEFKGEFFKLIQISREQFDALREANLIKFGMDKNYRITGNKKKSNRKKYYVVEMRNILSFLGIKPEKY